MAFGKVAHLTKVLPLFFACFFVAACEPCSGVLSCGDPQLRYRGQLIESHSGNPVKGATLEFVPTGGVSTNDPITAETDSLGVFRLLGATTAAGQISGDFIVLFTDRSPVDTIRNLTLSTSRASDSRYLGEWNVRWPHFDAFGFVYTRATGMLAAGVEVEFRRTGGIPVDPDTFTVRSDAFGNFPLRPAPMQASGEVVGELIVRAPRFPPDTLHGVRFRTQAARQIDPVVRVALGEALPFVGRALWSDDGSAAAGLEVEFQRTGGIQVEPARYVTTTVEWGGFNLMPVPLEEGVVDFTLTFRRPGGAVLATYPYSLRTTENEQITLAETWLVPR